MDQVPSQMMQVFKILIGAWPGIFLAVFLFFAMINPSGLLGDPGVYWHIRAGEWMLDHLRVLRHDPFSQSGMPWVPTQWLAEIVMALAYQTAGFAGVTTLASLLIATWVSIPVRRWFLAGMHPILVWFLALVVLKVGAIQIHARPLLVTFLSTTILAFTIADIERGRSRVSRMIWLLFLAVLWANCHGGYLGGLAMLGVAGTVWTVQACFGTGPLAERNQWWLFAFGMLGWVLAPLVSPFGFGLYQEWFSIWFKLDLSSYILEHQPPQLTDFYMITLYVVTLILVLFMLLSQERKKCLASLAIFASWLVMTFKRSRNAPLAISSVTPFFEEAWLQAVQANKVREDWVIRNPMAISNSILGGVVLFVAGVFCLASAQKLQVQAPQKLPLDMVEALQGLERTHGHGAPVYNELNDGGFLIFFARNLKAFQDDRCEIHAFREGNTHGNWQKHLLDLELNQPEALLAELQKRNIHIVFIPQSNRLSEVLAKNPSWKAIQKGSTHTIWVHSDEK